MGEKERLTSLNVSVRTMCDPRGHTEGSGHINIGADDRLQRPRTTIEIPPAAGGGDRRRNPSTGG